MPRFCIYLRKSRQDVEAEHRGEEESLARHKRTLLELARRDGYGVDEIYQEVVSGDTIAQRPEMRRLLGDVQAGLWDGVLVMEVERLARGDTIDQGLVAQTFKYSNTLIITPSKVYDPNNEFDEEYFEFSLFMSRREYKSIRRRQEAGKEAACKEGRWIANVTPYGYTRIRNEDGKGWRLAPDPAEADVLRRIFVWYVDGDLRPNGEKRRLGISMICRKLHDLGIRTRTGDSSWSTATVRGILGNPVYTGVIRRGRRRRVKSMVDGQLVVKRPHNENAELYPGLHEALISQEVFQTAQEYLRANRPPSVKDRGTLKSPLAGLIVCGRCGRRMVRRSYQSGRVASLICYDPQCPTVSADIDRVEKRILAGIADWVERYEVQESAPVLESYAAEQRALDDAEARRTELKKQMTAAYELLERGIYADAEFFERRAVLTQEAAALEEACARLQAEIDRKCEHNEYAKTCLPKWKNVLDAYADASITGKNIMLKEIIEKIVYTREESGRFTGIYDNFVLEIFPRIPKGEKHL